MKPVIDRLDHQMINDLDPFKVLNPSAENLAKYFYDETNVNLDRLTQGRVRVKNVTVFRNRCDHRNLLGVSAVRKDQKSLAHAGVCAFGVLRLACRFASETAGSLRMTTQS